MKYKRNSFTFCASYLSITETIRLYSSSYPFEIVPFFRKTARKELVLNSNNVAIYFNFPQALKSVN